jgi:hypothetical protein
MLYIILIILKTNHQKSARFLPFFHSEVSKYLHSVFDDYKTSRTASKDKLNEDMQFVIYSLVKKICMEKPQKVDASFSVKIRK